MANISLNRINYKFYMRKALETKLVNAFVFSIYILFFFTFFFTLTAGIKRKRKYNTPKYIGIQL